MDDERLWAPWRLGYILEANAGQGGKSPAAPCEPSAWRDGADRDCFLCRAAADYVDPAAARREQLILDVGEHIFAMLNRYPYNNGHLLVSPRRHVAEFHDLTAAEHAGCMATLVRFTQLFSDLIHAQGFNVGLNLGRAAGAGVPGHIHWHLVPRWNGDSNFMPTTSGTRVIAQSLEELWQAIATKYDAAHGSPPN